MNFTKLRYIVAVDREGSISAAAKRLNISQSAVTKAVGDIEGDLGFAIFHRRAHGVSATPEGREFVDRVARILSDVGQLESDMREGHRARDLLLRIAVTPSSLEGLMNRSVVALLLKNPKLRLHMRGTNLENGIHLLRQGDIDALIGPQKALAAEPGFTCSQMPPLHPFLYARKDHPLIGRRKLAASDIAAFPIVAPDIQGPLVSPLLEVLDLLGGDPLRRLHIIETYPIAARLIEQSDAIGVVLKNFASSSEFASRFSLLDFDMGGALSMAVAWHKARQVSLPLQRFLDALSDNPPTG
jgi:DNA-binding transcriptional LysR family regulator